jgi:hypothetical protein
MTTKAVEACYIKQVADYICEGLPETPARARRALAAVEERIREAERKLAAGAVPWMVRY